MEATRLLSWDENKVAAWVSSIGFAQYAPSFKDQDITGELLVQLDSDVLKQLRVKSVGHRLTILQSITKLKLQHGFQEEEISMSRPLARLEEKLMNMIRDKDVVIETLSKQVKAIQESLESLRNGSSLGPRPKSPERTFQILKNGHGHIRVFNQVDQNNTTAEYKTISISVEENCAEVIPKIMKKWKLLGDWKKFALFIIIDGVEKCLSFDDHPLKLLQSYIDTDVSAVFIIKAIRTHSIYFNKSESTSLRSKVSGSLSMFSNDALASKEFGTRSNNELGIKAYAIYEYQAQQDDELDVNIGDEFSIEDKPFAEWWEVLDKNGRSGIVPARCLVEESEANTESKLLGETIALYDYEPVGVNELHVKKGDRVNVRKQFKHWLVAEVNGRQGWLPTCYISAIEKRKESGSGSLVRNDEDEKNNIVRSPFMAFEGQTTRELSSFSDDVKSSNSKQSLRKYRESLNQLSQSLSKKQLVDSKTADSLSSPAVLKLDSLLDNFDPFEDDPKLDGSLDKDLRARLVATKQNEIEIDPKLSFNDLLIRVTSPLQQIHAEIVKLSNSSNTTVDPESILGTNDLIQHVEGLNPSKASMTLIFKKLEGPSTKNKQALERIMAMEVKDAATVNKELQTLIEQTQEILTDVINIFLDDIQQVTSAETSRNTDESSKSLSLSFAHEVQPRTSSLDRRQNGRPR